MEEDDGTNYIGRFELQFKLGDEWQTFLSFESTLDDSFGEYAASRVSFPFKAIRLIQLIAP